MTRSCTAKRPVDVGAHEFLDPMLATGGSATDATMTLREDGACRR